MSDSKVGNCGDLVGLLREIASNRDADEKVKMLFGGAADRIEELQAWVNDLQAGMYINCVYCGHRYGPDSEVPATMADALKEHIEQCPEHPMSELKRQLQAAEAEVERLNKWADGFSDAQLKERAACEAHNQELRDRAEALQAKLAEFVWGEENPREYDTLHNRLKAAEAKLAAIDLAQRHRIVIPWGSGSYMKSKECVLWSDIDAILRGESEDSGDE